MDEDGLDGGRIGEEGEDPRISPPQAGHRSGCTSVDAGDELSLPHAAGGRRGRHRLRLRVGRRGGGRSVRGVLAEFGLGPADEGDGGSQAGVRSEHSVVAVDARGSDQASEPLDQLQRGEQELGTAVTIREAAPFVVEGT